MFEEILIADRGDQPPTGGVAAEPNCSTAENSKRYFIAETTHV